MLSIPNLQASILVPPTETLNPAELAHPFISHPCNRLRLLSRLARPLAHHRATLHRTLTMALMNTYRQNRTQRHSRSCNRSRSCLQLTDTVRIAWGKVTHGYLQGQWLALLAQLHRNSAARVRRLCVHVPTHTSATAGRVGKTEALAGNQCTRKLRLRGHLAWAAAG